MAFPAIGLRTPTARCTSQSGWSISVLRGSFSSSVTGWAGSAINAPQLPHNTTRRPRWGCQPAAQKRCSCNTEAGIGTPMQRSIFAVSMIKVCVAQRKGSKHRYVAMVQRSGHFVVMGTAVKIPSRVASNSSRKAAIKSQLLQDGNCVVKDKKKSRAGWLISEKLICAQHVFRIVLDVTTHVKMDFLDCTDQWKREYTQDEYSIKIYDSGILQNLLLAITFCTTTILCIARSSYRTCSA